MNRKAATILSLLVLLLLFGGVFTTARAADAVEVDVRNKNSFTITLTFVGPEIRQFSVAPGKSSIELIPGQYTHSYYGCGQLNFGNYTVKAKNNEIEIEPCNKAVPTGPAPNTELLNVRNRTSTSFPITFIGLESNKDYFFTVVPGNNKLYLEKGLYSYSYYACSALHYGTVKVTSRAPEMDIQTCSSSANGASLTDQLATFKLKNNTGGTVILVLNGHLDYLFAVSGSGTILTVEKGFYQYTMYACGTTYDGVIQVTAKPGKILRTPICKGPTAQ